MHLPPSSLGKSKGYPLVMTNIAIENHHFLICLMGKSTISMAMFNSYVSLPKGNYGKWMNMDHLDHLDI